MRTIETIQADIVSTERAIQAGGVEQSQIDLWNAQLAEFTKELQAAQQLQQDHTERVGEAVISITDTFDEKIDNYEVGGFKFSALCINPDAYGLVKIGMKQMMIAIATANSEKFSEIQASMQKQNSQIKLERDDFEQRFTNATALLDEANKKIAEQDSHITDLLKDAVVGARNGFKVIDTEEQQKQIEEFSQKINNGIIRITDLQPVDGGFGAKPVWYTAKDVLTGEVLRINWMALNNYKNLTDPNEVEQFRNSHATLPSVALDNNKVAIPPKTIDPVGLPLVPSFRQDQVQTADTAGDSSLEGNRIVSENVGQTITETQLEARLQQFAQEYQLVKQAVA